MSTDETPGFNCMYFDTNVLVGYRWPTPAPALYNLFRFGQWWKVTPFIPAPVIDEADAHWTRRVAEGLDGVAAASKKVRKASSPIACDVKVTHPTTMELAEQFRAAAKNTISYFGIETVPYTQRTTQEMFAFATRQLSPFAKDSEGKGFQDAVILVSVLDHLRDHPELRGALVTDDGDFAKLDYSAYISDFDATRLRVMKFDAVFRQLYRSHFNETRVKPYRRLLEAAEEFVKQRMNDVQNFVECRLTAEMIRPSFSDTVRSVGSIEQIQIRRVDFQFPEDEPINVELEITIKLLVTARGVVVTDFNMVRAFFGETDLPPAPVKEQEKKLSAFVMIRAVGEVVERELKNIDFRELLSDEM